MKELVMYRCNVCGNIICMINNSGVTPVCCGEEMSRIEIHTKDEFSEKHVPVIQQNGCRVQVTVGEVPHPMTDAHHIEWIVLITSCGSHCCKVRSCDKASAVFYLCEYEKIEAAYAFCNLHGLWKMQV